MPTTSDIITKIYDAKTIKPGHVLELRQGSTLYIYIMILLLSRYIIIQ